MRILVNHDGQQMGPYSLEEVRAALQAGSVNASDLAWVEGTPSWVPLSSIVNAPAGNPPGFGAAAQPIGSPSYAQQPYAQQGQAPTSGLAITSLVLGILSFLCLGPLMSIPGVICGHIARSKIKKSQGREKGEGLALGGLICGYINIALVPLFVAIMIPAFMQAKDKAEAVSLINDAREIAVGCQRYAIDHDGKYPQTLEELVPGIISDRALHRPNSPGFDYLAAGKTNPPDETIVVVGKSANKQGERVVARVSGAAGLEKVDPGALPR